MSVFLHGLALEFFRGIGPEMQKLGPFKRFNFFIGANNAGKSTVLEFLSKYLPTKDGVMEHGWRTPLHDFRGEKTGTLKAAIGIPVDDFRKAVLKLHPHVRDAHVPQLLDMVIRHFAEDNLIWVVPRLPNGGDAKTFLKPNPKGHTEWNPLADHEWHDLWFALTQQRDANSNVDVHWYPETISKLLTDQNLDTPTVRLIPAIRDIGPKGGAFSDLSGTGLIDRLAEIQSPDHDRREERLVFDRINSFVQNVIGKRDAVIEIPHNRDHILVHMDNKVLPLGSLGTGLTEVIMIASFCTIHDNMIICMEEPEIHLHPLLQRKLMMYLSSSTHNQYFIATHSAAFIDTQGAAIFHVTNDGVQSRIRETVLRSEKIDICADLGYRASDILQSNAVIWVEGPSDRIYIREWIRLTDPSLVEGVHYSIMFYGGRLLSHLSADADEINDFIGLRALNQHLALVMDSDRASAYGKINETKMRLKSEFSQGSGVCWLTKGREIENYVEHGRLQSAVKTLYSRSYGRAHDGGTYDHALFYTRSVPKASKKATVVKPDDLVERDIDKVRVAHQVVSSGGLSLDVLDVRKRVEDLVTMIIEANQ